MATDVEAVDHEVNDDSTLTLPSDEVSRLES